MPFSASNLNTKGLDFMLSPRSTTNALLFMIAILFGGVILKLAQPVLVPFVLACFLTAALYPIIRWMNRYVPRWLSLLLWIGFFSFLILSDALIFLFNLEEITQKVPQYNQRIQKLVLDITKVAEQYGLRFQWKNASPEQATRWLLSIAGTWISSLFLILGEALLVVFLMIFLLLESHQFENKIRVAFASESSYMVLDSIYSINEQIQQYMVTKTFISLLTGVMTGLATYFLGVDFPVLWGIIAFLLNYIPNIGSIVAVIPPVIVALLQKEQSYGLALATLASLTMIQTIIGNVLDPRITGRSLDLSPLVVFVSLIFWGWMWGIIGMILAVPLTVVIKVVCEHNNNLRPVAILLGGDPTHDPSHYKAHSTAQKPKARWEKNLLDNDFEDDPIEAPPGFFTQLSSASHSPLPLAPKHLFEPLSKRGKKESQEDAAKQAPAASVEAKESAFLETTKSKNGKKGKKKKKR